MPLMDKEVAENQDTGEPGDTHASFRGSAKRLDIPVCISLMENISKKKPPETRGVFLLLRKVIENISATLNS